MQAASEPRHSVTVRSPEVWDSVDSHKAAVKDIPPEMIMKVMELLEDRPSGEYFHE